MNIYIVFHSQYDYESTERCPILATPYLPIAERKKAEMEDLRVKVMATKKAIQSLLADWEKTNPRIHPGTPKLKLNPGFKGPRKKWTDEQRAEYDRIKVENFDLAVAAAKPAHDWVNAHYAEQQRLTATQPKEVQDNLLYIDERSIFEIEEVPYAES